LPSTKKQKTKNKNKTKQNKKKKKIVFCLKWNHGNNDIAFQTKNLYSLTLEDEKKVLGFRPSFSSVGGIFSAKLDQKTV